MTTNLLLQIREQVKARLAEKDTLLKEQDVRAGEARALIADAEKRGEELDAKESARFRELTSQMTEIDQRLAAIELEYKGLQERENEILAFEKADDNARKAAEQWANRADDPASVAAPARVRSEARTYSPDSEKRGTSFFRDLYASSMYHDPDAAARLERHSREARLHEAAGIEARDVGTTQFGALTVPAYLTELAAPAARAMAPTVAITNRHPLPDKGMTVEISRITTGSATAAQATQHDAVQETDMDDTALSVPVRTYAGQQDVSRQALDRSTGVDDIIAEDLSRAYWTKLDDAILNAAGTLGTHLSIRSTSSIIAVTYTDTTPTFAEIFPKFADLIQQIQSGVYMGISHFIMHPRRWWWLAKELGSSFPLLTMPSAGNQQVGTVGGTDYMGENRSLLGVPVVLDGNIPTNVGTNEDVILGVTARELHLWEGGGPLLVRAEQTAAGNLAVKFVVYQYSAFTAGRYPGAHGTISGSGLTAPTF
jgi:HK97 family phage major capsid protein